MANGVAKGGWRAMAMGFTCGGGSHWPQPRWQKPACTQDCSLQEASTGTGLVGAVAGAEFGDEQEGAGAGG